MKSASEIKFLKNPLNSIIISYAAVFSSFAIPVFLGDIFPGLHQDVGIYLMFLLWFIGLVFMLIAIFQFLKIESPRLAKLIMTAGTISYIFLFADSGILGAPLDNFGDSAAGVLLGASYLFIIAAIIFISPFLLLKAALRRFNVKYKKLPLGEQVSQLQKKAIPYRFYIPIALAGTLTALFIAVFFDQQAELKTANDRLAAIEEKLENNIRLSSCTPSDVVDDVSSKIVRVVGISSEGSGVLVSNNGRIVTNYHVIAGEPSPTIVFPDYSKKVAKILMADRNTDLALLKIDQATPDFMPLWKKHQPLSALDTVFSFGFPLGTDIAGGVTVQEGKFVSSRDMDGVTYIHTDLSLQPGQSGGALTDSCGNLIGINTMALSGASFSIDLATVNWSISNGQGKDNPVADVEAIEFKEDESALEAVRAFYNYQTVHQLDLAYELLAPEYLDGITFEEWSEGYNDTIGVELIKIEESEDDPNLIEVKFAADDLVGQDRVTRYFEGTWEVEERGGRWLLTDPEITEVAWPEWNWFLS